VIGSLGVMSVVAGAFVLAQSRTPRSVVPTDVDLGIVHPGQIVDAAIPVENTGRAPLHILRVRPCCGVSVLSRIPLEIPARSAGIVRVRVRGHAACKPVRGNIFLEMDDESQPCALVGIKGDADPSLPLVWPNNVLLGYTVPGQEFTDVLQIRPREKDDYPRHVAASTSLVHPSLRKSREGLYAVDLEVAADATQGGIAEFLYVTMNSSENPNVIVPFSVHIERALQVRPAHLCFGLVDGQEMISRTIQLRRIDVGWELLEVSADDSAGCVELRLEPTGEGTWRLHVSLDPSQMPDILDSHISVRGNKGEVIRIPLLAARRPD